MSYQQHDLWGQRSWNFFQLEFHSSSSWGTLKIALSDFLVELEQQKMSDLLQPLIFDWRRLQDNLKQKLASFELDLLQNLM